MCVCGFCGGSVFGLLSCSVWVVCWFLVFDFSESGCLLLIVCVLIVTDLCGFWWFGCFVRLVVCSSFLVSILRGSL